MLFPLGESFTTSKGRCFFLRASRPLLPWGSGLSAKCWSSRRMKWGT